MTRERIYGEITTERMAQDALGYGPEHDDHHTSFEWVALIARHAGLGIEEGARGVDAVRFRRQMVRVAALAVAAVESLDRQAGREAVAGEYRQGSGY